MKTEGQQKQSTSLIREISLQKALLRKLKVNANDPQFVRWKSKVVHLLRRAVPDSAHLGNFERLTFSPLPSRVEAGEQFPASALQRRSRFLEDRTASETVLNSVIKELRERLAAEG
jgi:hypothetical protein